MAYAIVSTLLDQLTSVVVQEIGEKVKVVTGVSEEVNKLSFNLRAIQAVVNDAEQRQLKEEAVRHWLGQLKDASYDMEDVLDEWSTSRLKLQIEGADENALVPQKTVCSFFTSPCFCSKKVSLRRDIAHKIRKMNENLADLAKSKDKFNFHVDASTSSVEKPERVKSASLIDESEIHCRDHEKNTLISKLVSESSQKQKGLHVISIVGVGGIGKTTLAQLAYNSKEVIREFEKRIWVSVSESFDEFRIAKAITEAVEGFPSSLGDFQPLLDRLYESINGKKFLLVLDNMWNEDYNQWEPFKTCLTNGNRESKILITTRKEKVACMVESNDIISLKLLSEDECWLLFRRFAFLDRSDEECEELEAIGRKIVGKCKGLPLSAKFMGSLLRFKKTRDEWQNILDNEMWEFEEFENSLVAPLLLSYYNLPSILRLCFSYCAVFPKNHNINKDELIYLWMAQGYLSVEQNKEMEIIGQKYFDILSTRSFFQEFVKDDYGVVTGCKMHDIVHDFAQFLRSNECFTLEINGPEEPPMNSFHGKAHHSMIMLDRGASLPLSICRVKRMRTLLIRNRNFDFSSFNNVLPKLFVELTCLRALDMPRGYRWGVQLIYEVPTEVGKLLHLRYLSLHFQNITCLPDTLCELYNLQTLDISSCRYLKELPQGIGKLINLRHLVNDMTDSLSYMPKGMERLTCLRTLKEFVVGEGVDVSEACSLESLKYLNLVGYLQIRGLENVSDVGEAKRSQLKNMKGILQLYLHFGYGKEGERGEEDEALLEALQPHSNLESLEIYGYRGNSFSPSWLMSLTNLRSFELGPCKNLDHFPPLGKLPSLERLTLWGIRSVKRVGKELLGIESEPGTSSSSSVVAFPKLKSFQFYELRKLEEWDYGRIWKEEKDVRVMPCLSCLKLNFCPKLKALPDHLLQTTTLQQLKITDCPILEDRYTMGRREDWPKISHIPNIMSGNEVLQGDRF